MNTSPGMLFYWPKLGACPSGCPLEKASFATSQSWGLGGNTHGKARLWPCGCVWTWSIYIYIIWFVPQMATLLGMMLNHGFGSCPLNIQTNPLQFKGSWWPWVFHPGCDDSGSLLGCPSAKTLAICGNQLGITWKMASSLFCMNDCNFADLIWFACVLWETQTDFNQDRVNLLVMVQKPICFNNLIDMSAMYVPQADRHHVQFQQFSSYSAFHSKPNSS